MVNEFLVGDHRIYIEANESLIAECAWLEGVIRDAVSSGFSISDGARLSVGWATFEFRLEGSSLKLFEPNYDADPFVDLRADISESLAVISRQIKLNSDLGLNVAHADWAQKVVVCRGIFDSMDFYAERQESLSRDDSGWFFGSMDEPDSGKHVLESIRSFELLLVSPDLSDILLLPPGFLVIFKAKKIFKIIQP